MGQRIGDRGEENDLWERKEGNVADMTRLALVYHGVKVRVGKNPTAEVKIPSHTKLAWLRFSVSIL